MVRVIHVLSGSGSISTIRTSEVVGAPREAPRELPRSEGCCGWLAIDWIYIPQDARMQFSGNYFKVLEFGDLLLFKSIIESWWLFLGGGVDPRYYTKVATFFSKTNKHSYNNWNTYPPWNEHSTWKWIVCNRNLIFQGSIFRCELLSNWGL